MAAGLGFKDFTTGEVLTAADVDGYLMQGIWVFASAAARDAAVTSPQEGNFAFLKDTNVTTYYTGSAWTNLDTTGMVNPMTTTGDTIYSSSGSTPARLGIGTAGQVLQVNSGATAPEWATPAAGGGAFTLINSGGSSLTGASVTVSSIPTTYTDLYVIIRDYSTNTDNDGLLVRINADTGTNYAQRDDFTTGAALTWNAARWNVSEGNDNSVADGLTVVYFYDYANTATYKMANYYTVSTDGSNTSNYRYRAGGALYKITNTAITSLTFLPEALGTFSSGTVYVYGVK